MNRSGLPCCRAEWTLAQLAGRKARNSVSGASVVRCGNAECAPVKSVLRLRYRLVILPSPTTPTLSRGDALREDNVQFKHYASHAGAAAHRAPSSTGSQKVAETPARLQWTRGGTNNDDARDTDALRPTMDHRCQVRASACRKGMFASLEEEARATARAISSGEGAESGERKGNVCVACRCWTRGTRRGAAAEGKQRRRDC